MTSIWVKFRFKKEIPTSIWVKFHFNIGLVCLVVLSCLACHLGRLTVRVSFLSSSRARGRQDRTARLGRAPGSEALDRQDRTTRCCLARTAGRPRASGLLVQRLGD